MWGQVVVGIIFLVFMVVWFFAIWGWFESRELWNGGICQETGKPWRVVEIKGVLHLESGDVFRRVSGLITYGPIIDRLRQSEA